MASTSGSSSNDIPYVQSGRIGIQPRGVESKSHAVVGEEMRPSGRMLSSKPGASCSHSTDIQPEGGGLMPGLVKSGVLIAKCCPRRNPAGPTTSGQMKRRLISKIFSLNGSRFPKGKGCQASQNLLSSVLKDSWSVLRWNSEQRS